MNASYQIRLTLPADSGPIAAVAARTWKATYANVLPDVVQSQALASWYSESNLARQAVDPKFSFLVATDGELQVVGFAMMTLRRQPGEAELLRFYVLPEHQGKGLGRRLLNATIEAVREKGSVLRVYAQVEKENWIGRRAYEALGFTLIREYADELFGYRTTAVELALDVCSPDSDSARA